MGTVINLAEYRARAASLKLLDVAFVLALAFFAFCFALIGAR